ncbi:MAG: sigma-70 family RNA polymerase sigma factor [Clostridia bacterium]|nr:sigma-70 family RNA polymerase sigma factor [Clostridia bacterium]
MAFFTQQEFHKMLFELTQSDAVCYNTLINIAEKTLYKSVCGWCNQTPVLKNCEEDLMQEIYIRLIKKCVTGFIMRDGVINDDPEGFKNWLFTVAKNIRNDFAKKMGAKELYEPNTPDGELPEGVCVDTAENDYDYDLLNRCFCIVLNSDSKVHIPLTWVTMMLVIAKGGLTRIEATESVVNICDGMNLDQMLDFITKQSETIIWLNLNQCQLDDVRKKLDEKDSCGVRTGDKKYSDFYMKKGAKASVSDWVNRMNSRIEKEVG